MTRPLRLRRKDVPAYLAEHHGIPMAVGTLNKLATIGGGPAMDYYGRIPLYRTDELDRWAREKIAIQVTSTSMRKARDAKAAA